MADKNDTAGARLKEGYNHYDNPEEQADEDYYIEGSLGREYRIDKAKHGTLKYSSGRYTRNGGTAPSDGGKLVDLAFKYGLPRKIRGNPLGCSCPIAYLAGATKPVGSHIEADYMCDAGWHNYVTFELIGFENKGESIIKVDANGNLIEDTKTQPRELQDF